MYSEYPSFTDEQVRKLREWQTCGWVHPFTCCDHQTMHVDNHGFLCLRCNRVQKHCHDFMLKGPGPNPLTLPAGPIFESDVQWALKQIEQHGPDQPKES